LQKWSKVSILKLSLSLVLLFDYSNTFSQFNSVVKQEEPISIKLFKVSPRVEDTLKRQVILNNKVEEVEDLKNAPRLFDLRSCENAEALINSNLGAHLPLDQLLISSSFGFRIHPITKKNTFHTGVDFGARAANIYAVLHGFVQQTGYNSKIGNYITLTHGNYTTIYGHLSRIFVNQGDLVKSGEVIGISGSTGQVTGEHLHFTVKYKGNLVHPLLFLSIVLKANPSDLYTTLLN